MIHKVGNQNSGSDEVLSLGTVLWGDCVNRIDTVILELRHLQLNLIKVIKEPVLYNALAYEESFLWGKYWNGTSRESWSELYKVHGLSEANSIPTRWIIPFPNTSELQTNIANTKELDDFFDKPQYDSIWTEIKKVVHERNLKDDWGTETYRIYSILTATQRLKLELLKDKFIFCFWGHQFVSSLLTTSIDQEKDVAIGRFVTIRSGVLHKIRNHINVLRDLRSPIERSLDLSTLDDPRPLAMRRKGQGLYNEFLNERALQYHSLIRELLVSTGDLSPETNRIPTHHRWTYSAISRVHHFRSTGLSEHSYSEVVTDQFINSMFWLTDRIDVEPSLAHECGHYYMKELFGDIGEAALKRNEGLVSDLIRSLSRVFHIYRNPMREDEDYPVRDLHVVRELAVDLIAAASSPHAYLWAITLELMGMELFESLTTPESECDLLSLIDAERASKVLTYPTTADRSDHLWSVRLLVMCDWVEMIEPSLDCNPLAQNLRRGIKEATIRLLNYIDRHSPLQIAGGRGVIFVKNLSDELIEVLRSHELTKCFQKNGAHPKTLLEGPLNINVRRHIYEQLLDTKKSRERALLRNVETRRSLLEFSIKGSDQVLPLDDVTCEIEDNNLFLTRSDVPWSAFLIRAEEIIVSSRKTRDSTFILNQITSDFNPGQETSTLLLDLSIWLNCYPNSKLIRAAKLVSKYLESTPNDSLLQDWLSKAQKLITTKTQPGVDPARRELLRELNRVLGNMSSSDTKLTALRSWLSCTAVALEEESRLTLLKKLLDGLKYSSGPNKNDTNAFVDNGVLVRINFSGSRPNANTPDSGLGHCLDVTHNWLQRASEEQSKKPIQELPRRWSSIYTPTLGRFDGVGIASSDYEQFMPIPARSNSESSPSKDLLPFSLRSERVFPITILTDENHANRDIEDISRSLCAVLAIKLAARDDRIDACLRFCNLVGQGLEAGGLSGAQEWLKSDDQLLLSDGDSDLLLFIYGDPKERLADVFRLSEAITNDFMFESCETIHATRCIGVFDSVQAAEFSLSLQIRLHRTGQGEGIANLAKSHLNALFLFDQLRTEYGIKVNWRDIPGRLDFEVYLDGESVQKCIHIAEKAGLFVEGAGDQRYLDTLAMLLGLHEKSLGPVASGNHKTFCSIVDETISTIGRTFTSP